MYKVACLAFAVALSSVPAFAADEEKQEVSEFKTEVTYFNYTSDRCSTIKDADKLYSIGMSLRDSSDAKEQISAVDCLIGAAIRAYGPAEYELARMYSIGSVVAQSPTFAYRWAQMAVMDGYKPAISLRDNLEKELTVDELEQAFNDTKRIYEEREKARLGDDATRGTAQNQRRINRTPARGRVPMSRR